MHTAREISKLWNLFPPDEPRIIEMRSFHYLEKHRLKSKLFRSDDYVSLDAFRKEFEDYAISVNEDGFNVYMTLNPIRENILGRSASDGDISYRDTLLVDIDRASGTKQPASDWELSLADTVAERISTDLECFGWGRPVRVMSGNGHHLYYRLDNFPNNDETSLLVKQFLHELGHLYDTSDIKVDPVVHNASRITKVPGTIMRKGQESEGRPYRTAKFL